MRNRQEPLPLHLSTLSAPVVMAAIAAITAIAVMMMSGTASAADPCAIPVTNKVACENTKPGTPPSEWQIDEAGDQSIQGFATSISVNLGQTVNFKIKTPASSYHIDILRLGYYGGDGARMIASNIKPSVSLPQTQPACLTNSSTGLIDCGNWKTSASWTVPSTAVSGLYIAHLVRNDTGEESQIFFVVRDDASKSAVLLKTSDATWEAYNAYGGNSLYSCTVACPPGEPQGYKAAYAVSYNRPFDGTLETDSGMSDPFYSEYQLIRFLERNGYDLSYAAQPDVDASSTLLKNHKILISSGHDEYWASGERQNFEAARNAGVSLAFFSGNELFWKTRWEASSDGSKTPYRTLVTYKETHFPSPVDPAEPAVSTTTWRDPRFSPPGDAGKPENSLSGQIFLVNAGTSDIKVPGAFSKLRFWRNTAVSTLGSSQTLTLSPGTGTLGYEWDVDQDNGFRPAGRIPMSSTTVSGLQTFTDYGTEVNTNSSASHSLSLYRAPSGALVFGAGTVQWSWGLDNTNAWGNYATDPSGNAPDPTMQQATVNLFADMGAQPATLQSGLVAASKTTDTTAPTAVISSPTAGTKLPNGKTVKITGTATDKSGVVAAVEVSTDNGATWHPASGTASWTYSWTADGSSSMTIKARAIDDSGNIGTASAGTTVSVSCPCSALGDMAPTTIDAGDPGSVELGVKFRSDVAGIVTGIRFFKSSANTGTHIGTLWSASGEKLAEATFSGESSSGWQEVSFANPVTIQANTTYVAGYFAPKGHYSVTETQLNHPPATGPDILDAPPLHILPDAGNGNGLYGYTSTPDFPTNSYHASNYWVDVQFAATTVPGQVTKVAATAGPGEANVTWTAPTGGATPTSYRITPYVGSTPQTPTTVAAPATSKAVTGLTPGTAYTFVVTALNAAGAGPDSSPSNAVTPTATKAPDTPTGVSALAKSSGAQLSWTAPANNGSPISGYRITPYIGANAQTATTTSSATPSASVTGLTNGTAYTFKVAAINGVGTSADSTASNAVTPYDTILDLGQPSTVDSGDAGSVELGVKFRSDVSGAIAGIRFYKAATNVGTHIGSLWDSSGKLLAQATFSEESASGWQQVKFSSPVEIQANTTYVAGYLAPQGHFSMTRPGFASAFDNAPLHALADSTSSNGVFFYSGTPSFPSNTYGATNYWVDVLFLPTPPLAPPGQATGASATAGLGSATVSWSAPSSGGAPTSYVVTPFIGTTAQTSKTITGTPPATTTTISSLTPGTSYTFTVQAANTAGPGPASSPSNAVTPSAAGVPTAPTAVIASARDQGAAVSWNPPADDGGSSIVNYRITPYIGGTAQTPTTVSGSATSATVNGLTNGTSYTFTVTAISGVGDGAESSPTSAVVPRITLFEQSLPATPDVSDDSSVELGVKFNSDVAGKISGIRFYKGTGNTGTHVVSLWNSGGTLLAQATATGETATGWQEVNFESPVSITAGTTYVAGYLAPKGHYSATGQGFASAINNPPLHAPASSIDPNGVYAYSSTPTFPTSSYNATNYSVDVLFTP